MKPATHLTLAILTALPLFAGGCSQSTPRKEPVTDECGAIKRVTTESAIINGVDHPDPAVVNLTPEQRKAVGALFINMGEAMCSATLIAPDTVLTASHCIDFSVRSVSFLVGNDWRSAEGRFTSTEWHRHPLYAGDPPMYDVAIIKIAGDTAAAGITPIPPNCVTTRLLGKDVQAVGFGVTDPQHGWNTRKWWTVLNVDTEGPTQYGAYGNEQTGICEGDSGGPMLFTMPDGLVRVMGVVSVGDSEDCLGHAYYPRTDYYCEFIQSYLPPPDPCQGETAGGRCDGSSAVFCEAGAIVRDDCAARGFLCGVDAGGLSRCQAPPDPCEGETAEGRCDGGAAIWCEGGGVRREPCGEGTLCGDAGDGLSRCVDECTLIGIEGRCTGEGHARWCEDGVVKDRDCAGCALACGPTGDVLGFYCL